MENKATLHTALMNNDVNSEAKPVSAPKYMEQLDGFRFIAVAGVMCGHWVTYSILKQFNYFVAGNGVNLFFVLSGFLITQILLVQKTVAVQPVLSLNSFMPEGF